MKNLRINIYFILTISMSFLCWFPQLLMNNGIEICKALLWLSNLYIFCPLLISIIFLLLSKNIGEWLSIIKPKMVRFDWMFVFLGGGGIVGTTIYCLVAKEVRVVYYVYPSIITALVISIYLTFTGAIEEVVWRGFVFKYFRNKKSILAASIYTGIIWSAYHMPMWCIRNKSSFIIVFLSIIMVMNVSIILGYMFEKSKSIISTIIGHLFLNIFFLWDGKTVFLYVANIICLTLITSCMILFSKKQKFLTIKNEHYLR